jgi:AcrR family transcriptional regulator
MLLYYFESRDELLAACLDEISRRLRGRLGAALPAGRATPAQALAAASAAMADPAVQAELQLWVEVVALAARGDQACARVAGAVVDDWSSWLAGRVDPPEAAAGVIALADGMLILRLAGRDDLARAAARAWG